MTEADLDFVEEAVAAIGRGQAFIRTLLLSLDPSNRLWMSEARGYVPPVRIDAVIRGIGHRRWSSPSAAT